MKLDRQTVYLYMLVLVGVVCLGVFVYDEVTRQVVDDTVKNILAFITGTLTHQLGGSQGSAQTQSGVALGYQQKNGVNGNASTQSS